jgi:hypothetical protein
LHYSIWNYRNTCKLKLRNHSHVAKHGTYRVLVLQQLKRNCGSSVCW